MRFVTWAYHAPTVLTIGIMAAGCTTESERQSYELQYEIGTAAGHVIVAVTTGVALPTLAVAGAIRKRARDARDPDDLYVVEPATGWGEVWRTVIYYAIGILLSAGIGAALGGEGQRRHRAITSAIFGVFISAILAGIAERRADRRRRTRQ